MNVAVGLSRFKPTLRGRTHIRRRIATVERQCLVQLFKLGYATPWISPGLAERDRREAESPKM